MGLANLLSMLMPRLKHLLVLAFLAMASVLQAASPLVNPNANHDAKVLMAYLRSVYGKKIISGQMNDKWLSYIKTTTDGKEPALMGYDFNGICPGQGGNTDADKAIKWVKERGGIAQFNWHWISPNGPSDGDWSSAKFNLTSALANPEGQDYKNMLRDMDLVAAEIKKMQDAGVAIIWRPLHEAEGAWFWWGKYGGDSCKALYRLMYDRYTNHHKLNNIIWCWNSYAGDKPNWYPGDDVVDFFAYDYPSYPGTTWNRYQSLFGSKGKMFAIGEDGKLFDPALLSSEGWLYFLTWDYMVQDPSQKDGKNTAAWLKQVYNDARVVTLTDVKMTDPDAVALPELVKDSTSTLANMSVLTETSEGNALIMGFVIAPSASGPAMDKNVLIRVNGPVLKLLGVTSAALDPYLELYEGLGDAAKMIASNDDHRPEIDSYQVSSAGWTQPKGSNDAALVVRLKPGVSYTVHAKIRGAKGTVQIELFALP
jgi:hypothetical protein